MWLKIRDDTFDDLRQSVKTNRLIITGISLGGGLASLSYIDIKATGEFENVEVITFGSPRVGNTKWAEFFDSLVEHSRFYILDDPIAALPTCLLLCNYKQTGTAYVCTATDEVCARKDSDSAPSLTKEVAYLATEVKEHASEMRRGDSNGIVDHIFGYKKIKSYTLRF
eukprot:TRINITY_DN2932_c0_g1_i1.p1 TRINITY_DN2932_c0_g1~~TRINITY_DN2932_c0_g1_i1.p1  ORF type:complete len:168 (+),score=19.21 TRINITY_DN2932_c0_g1_i1:355-858(+)